MEPRKLTIEDIDKVRNMEGFPIGTDEDIIALSNAPYYTACPNPFIADFIAENGTPYDEKTDNYHREPYAADVSEGKNDTLYNAHSYHTKVPHKAIMRYILHYTKPGDVILDGFCGTGMVGLASQTCGTDDLLLQYQFEDKRNNKLLGDRKTILIDLSTLATYIAHNYCHSVDYNTLFTEARRIISICKAKYMDLYYTNHVDGKNNIIYGLDSKPIKGVIEYTVWSDVFICPNCSNELVYWDLAFNREKGIELKEIECPHCRYKGSKNNMERAKDVVINPINGNPESVAKTIPVYIKYKVAGVSYEKIPDSDDLKVINDIVLTSNDIKHSKELPDGFNTRQPKHSHGVVYTHQLYTLRNYKALVMIYSEIYRSKNYNLLTLITSVAYRNAMRCNRFVINKYNPRGRINGPRSLTLYIPSLTVEQNIFELIEYKFESLKNMYMNSFNSSNCIISTQSATDMRNIPDNSIDYIFTDPPFGSNINYSELNFVDEVWLNVYTNYEKEAIVNAVREKDDDEYLNLMNAAFKEYYRVLKPNRWITVEFHNAKNIYWNIIQNALQRNGFVIADVRVLDKKRGNLAQLINKSAVIQDLIIAAYKPKEDITTIFNKQHNEYDTVWSFVRQHLENINIVVYNEDNKIEFNQERSNYLLYDRMVAYHIVHGIPVPIGADDFYRELDKRYLKRDGMYFLPSQINEYDNARIKAEFEDIQMNLFVTNEKSAISWLYRQLSDECGGPQTYKVIQPKFMQEVKTVDKHEAIPELAILLEENFLQDEQGKWYIPDITKEGDLAKLREKNLWKEFEEYMNSKGKLKKFRAEAVRVGFSRLWKDKNYAAIVNISERLPEQTIQEDPNLLMYYDISLSRVK